MPQFFFGIFCFFLAFCVPLVPTVLEIVSLFLACTKKKCPLKAAHFFETCGAVMEAILFLIGVIYEYILLELGDVMLEAQWTEQLYNNEIHQPYNSDCYPTLFALLLLYWVGRFFLRYTKVSKTPPLLTVLAIAAMYAGNIYSILYTIQVYSVSPTLFLLILPFNLLVINARVVINKVNEYEPDPSRFSKIEGNPFLKKCLEILDNSKLWPIFAFVLMWPMLGIMIVVLLLFGQAPDSAIKGFTETSDFIFSTRIAPQNLYYDEHYLCTVAAGGDRKIVKPLRRGIRHGHEVIVNRQLCIANAFEQELEIHSPKFHRVVRNFYDKYGFPIAKLIKKKWVADIVYFIMKPLEWLFVVVIYLTEIHPEDRIAMQYTGAGYVYDGDRVIIKK